MTCLYYLCNFLLFTLGFKSYSSPSYYTYVTYATLPRVAAELPHIKGFSNDDVSKFGASHIWREWRSNLSLRKGCQPWWPVMAVHNFWWKNIKPQTKLNLQGYKLFQNINHVRSFSRQIPIISCNFQADPCPNQGGVEGQTNPQNSLLKLK